MKKKFKFIIYNDFNYSEGGASQIAIEQANNLASKGYEVTFIYAKRNNQENIGFLDKKIKTHFINLKYKSSYLERAFSQILHFFYLQKKLKKILTKEEEKNSIVLLHNFSKIIGSSILLFVRNFKTLIFMHSHMSCPTGFFFDSNDNKTCYLQPNSFDCLTKKCRKSYVDKYLFHFRYYLEKILISNIKKKFIISLSKSSLQLNKKNNYFKDINYKIENFVNTNYQKRSIVENNKFFLFIGRVTHEKGFFNIVDQFKKNPFYLTIVGAENKDKILKLFPVKHRKMLKIYNWLDIKNKFKILKKTKSIFFLSLARETFGLVPFEAAKFGIPIIKLPSYDNNFFEPGINSYEIKDINNLNKVIFKINNYKSEHKKISINLHRKFYNCNYSFNNHYKSLLKIIKKL